MQKISRLIILSILTTFLLTTGLGDFIDANAWERKRPSPTKSSAKGALGARKQKAITNWNSLSPEQQAHYEELAKKRGSKAKMTGQEYWNSMTPEEQQESLEYSRERVKKARKRWQSLPE